MGDELYQNHDLYQNIDLSFKYYQKALLLDLAKTEINWKIARILWIKQERTFSKEQKKQILELALSHLKPALEKNPADPQIRLWNAIVTGTYLLHTNFLRTLLFLKDTVKNDLDYVLSVNPKEERALFALSFYYQRLPVLLGGKPDYSLQLLQEILLINPNFHRARISLAKIFVKEEQFLAAKEVLEPIFDLPPAEVGYYFRHRKEAEDLLKRTKLAVF